MPASVTARVRGSVPLRAGNPRDLTDDPWSGPSVHDQPEPEHVPARGLARPDSRFVRLDGIEVHHRITGPQNAPLVVLLHHFYGNVATWRHAQADLADRYRLVAFDRPGFGLTERPSRGAWNGDHPYTRARSAKITAELITHLGDEQAVLIGSSAGGTTALETYAHHPERVRALVLVAPGITGDVGAPPRLRPLLRTPPMRRLGRQIVRRAGGEVTVERVTRNWHDPGRATAEDVAAYADLLRVEGWDAALWELFSAEPPPRLVELLGRIEVPTLLVTGAHDRVMAPALSQRVAAAIPGARYVAIPDCGHTPQEECPDAFATVVRDFLATLP